MHEAPGFALVLAEGCGGPWQGVISPVFVPTTEMPADLLTKPLARVKVQQFCKMLGLAPSGGS